MPGAPSYGLGSEHAETLASNAKPPRAPALLVELGTTPYGRIPEALCLETSDP